MAEQEFDKAKLMRYWLESSDEDFGTMLDMYASKRFTWALFAGHLSIEKLLKAHFVEVNSEHPPLIHNLLRLAEKCGLTPTEEEKLFFTTVTAFNINARYDDYKRSFRQRCTPEYTAFWIEKIKDQRTWMRERIDQ